MDNKPHSIEWTDDLSVHVKEIDDQHKTFIKILNDLYQSAVSMAPRSRIGQTINKTIDYAVMHFSTEEKYFDKFNYPLAAEHKEQHELLKQQAMVFKKRFESGEDLAFELLDFLEDWLVGHLATYDMKYSKFFNDHGLF